MVARLFFYGDKGARYKLSIFQLVQDMVEISPRFELESVV
ncbi:hypothetical protein N781_06565 [Pontibacillus halophilus JSM 076056 = DSM 19796]|uniref:Uncharacterized protein n=1 Tax=Pontibacillus halophilus JSM 076056 = DSM 19796 TaxID=1385510 RepID=A0A0A5GFH3_9BACI|nr:hypothetical protein N781_06565 [Pontibacillus halophilus JSM 076056 = DSM 19796]